MGIKENLAFYKSKIPEHVKLVAVSKTKPVSDILLAYNSGHIIFGENKAQELINKQPQLPSDIEWHFIGHMQSNKVKYIASYVHLIHSVDSLKLLKEVNKQAKVLNNKIDYDNKLVAKLKEKVMIAESLVSKNVEDKKVIAATSVDWSV